MKVYIAGKITGLENYKKLFDRAEKELIEQGHAVMNPSVLPFPGFEHHEYMHICYAMIDVCEAVYMLDNWQDSVGAKLELFKALSSNKIIIFQSGLVYSPSLKITLESRLRNEQAI